MGVFTIDWDRHRPCTTVLYAADRMQRPVVVFEDHDHFDYLDPQHQIAVFKRLLSYHLGHDPDDRTVVQFLVHPKTSKVVVTQPHLEKFFKTHEVQPPLRFNGTND